MIRAKDRPLWGITCDMAACNNNPKHSGVMGVKHIRFRASEQAWKRYSSSCHWYPVVRPQIFRPKRASNKKSRRFEPTAQVFDSVIEC